MIREHGVGGLINTIICFAAAVILYGTGHPILLGLSIACALLCVWSWGAMHNYAIDRAKARHDLMVDNLRAEGRSSEDIAAYDQRVVRPTSADINAVPNWLSVLSMLSTFGGVILLASAGVIRWL